MNTTKIYARKIPTEEQESPYFYAENDKDNNEYAGIILNGNKDYKTKTTPEFDAINENFYDLQTDFETVFDGEENTMTFPEFFAEYSNFTAPEGKQWTDAELKQWNDLLRGGNLDSSVTVTELLKLLTGHQWKQFTIRSSCQSDWNSGYYDVTLWNSEEIRKFEIEYFNTGTEWQVFYVSDDFSGSPEELDAYDNETMYCYRSGLEDIRAEIAEYTGTTPENVTLYTCYYELKIQYMQV